MTENTKGPMSKDGTPLCGYSGLKRNHDKDKHPPNMTKCHWCGVVNK